MQRKSETMRIDNAMTYHIRFYAVLYAQDDSLHDSGVIAFPLIIPETQLPPCLSLSFPNNFHDPVIDLFPGLLPPAGSVQLDHKSLEHLAFTVPNLYLLLP